MFADNKKWLFLIILSIIWGSSFILMKYALIGLSPIHLGALRILISGIFIFIIGYHKLKILNKKAWKWIAISGVLGTFFPAFLFAIAITEIDSSIASILNSLTPLNTIILGFVIFGITFKKRQLVGVIIGFLGTIMLIGAGAKVNPDQNYLYAGLILTATIFYALNINIIKKHLQNVSALGIATGHFAVVIIPAIIVLFTTGFFKSEVLNQPELKMSLVYVTILAIFGTALAKIMFNKMVQISTPVFASSVTYLIPVVALCWGIWDGESFKFSQALATILIFLGVYLANRRK